MVRDEIILRLRTVQMFSRVWSTNLTLISATSRRIMCEKMSSGVDDIKLPDGGQDLSEKSAKVDKLNCYKKEEGLFPNCKRTVNWEKLSKEEKLIYLAHNTACENRESIYIDPATGYSVLTEEFLRQRGTCCGNACRHCPFGHENVVPALKSKKFNSAFYV